MSIGPIEVIIVCIIGLLLLAILIGAALAIVFLVKRSASSYSTDRSHRVPCPYCAELILPDAKVCRYCGRDLENITTG